MSLTILSYPAGKGHPQPFNQYKTKRLLVLLLKN